MDYPVNLLVAENVERLESTIRRAKSLGCTHFSLADSKFSRLGEVDSRHFANVERVQKFADEL